MAQYFQINPYFEILIQDILNGIPQKTYNFKVHLYPILSSYD
jgi:hypothetical protein